MATYTEAQQKEKTQKQLKVPNKKAFTVPSISQVVKGEYAALLAILLMIVIWFAITSPVFFSSRNFSNLASSMAILGILAAGQLFVVMSGGIDISVAAQIGFLSIVAVDLSQNMPFQIVIPIVIALGALIGAVNGLLISGIGISPIIATVATLQVLTGASLLMTGGQPRRNFEENYTAFGTGSFLGIPYIAMLSVAVLLVGAFLLNRTKLGRYTVAIGGNRDAAYLAGIKVRSYEASTYVLNSIFVALAALALSSRTGSGLPDLGSGIEITTIAAVFIGGAAWGGGRGTIFGTFLGVLLIGIIGNGLDLNSVSSHLQTIITGVLMAVAVGLGAMRKRRT